jgi:hypothetical protein
MAKRLVRIALVALCLVAALYAALYVVGVRSEPYAVSIKFISGNEVVSQQIGHVVDTSLALAGFSISYHGPDGLAKFQINVVGSTGKGVVFAELERNLGEWKVAKARLRLPDGTAVNLVGS